MNALTTTTAYRLRKRGSFARLMELYENNYSRLRLLLPDLDAVSDAAESQVPDCIGLFVKVLERSRYTTTLRLHYAFSDSQDDARAPYLKIRIYHDARTAEALTGLIRSRRGGVDFVQSLHTRWQRNRFLYQWLGYCLRRGHRFGHFPGPAGPTLTPCELTT